jgi:Transposase DDE domain group 1
VNPALEVTLRVMHKGRAVKVAVRADGSGLVSHVGSGLLRGLADRLGLARALDRRLEDELCQRQRRHTPGRVIRDLAVMLADGGDCLSDLGALRGQESLFADVASDSTARRVIEQISELPGGLERVRAARAEVHARAFRRGARPRELRIDLDATLIDAHSEKQGAAATYKRGFGFHPMLAYLDGTGDALAGRMRPGNANANTAADQITVLADALAQLPRCSAAREPILMRADTAGATHELLDFCHDGNIRFSVGLSLTEAIRTAILALPERVWQTAMTQDGQLRDHDGAQVAELTDQLDLTSWPAGSRVIVRREEAHPGAQFSFTDHDGRRFQAVLTDQPDPDIAYLEAVHRGHARVEDRIRAAKDTGMANLPFAEFALNEIWLELVLLAQDLLVWTQQLLLDGELARAEPKRLRLRLLHTAGRLVLHARQAILHLPARWPWAAALESAFARLETLPAASR